MTDGILLSEASTTGTRRLRTIHIDEAHDAGA